MSFASSSPYERKCTGGPGGTGWCGKPATVVCSEGDERRPSQWFACDDPAHHVGWQGVARTEPISAWIARLDALIAWKDWSEAARAHAAEFLGKRLEPAGDLPKSEVYGS